MKGGTVQEAADLRFGECDGLKEVVCAMQASLIGCTLHNVGGPLLRVGSLGHLCRRLLKATKLRSY